MNQQSPIASPPRDVPLPRDAPHALPTAEILGLRAAAITESQAVDLVLDAADRGVGLWLVTANLDHLRRYRRESLAKRLIDNADVVVADGTPLIWASQLARRPLPERVAGSNLVWRLAAGAATRRLRVLLLGGDPGVGDRAAAVLSSTHPGLMIAGVVCPPFGFERSADEWQKVEAAVAQASPDIVLVALGFPKQDIVIGRLREIVPEASYVGVGISLSFVTGDVQRAPRWTHRVGLEWVHRLMQEPGRLGRRYLLQGLPFATVLFAWALLGRIRGTRHEILHSRRHRGSPPSGR